MARTSGTQIQKRQPLLRTTWFKIAVLTFLYYAAGRYAFSFFSQNAIVTPAAFIPEGIALAAALLYGYRILPGIFLGQLWLAYAAGLGALPSVSIAIVNMLEAAIAIVIFERYGFDTHLEKLRDVSGLIVTVLFVLQPFSALLGNTVLYYSGNLGETSFGQNLFFWWFGNVVGQLLITPFLLLLYHHIDKLKRRKNLFLFLSLLFAVWVLHYFITTKHLLLLMFATLPPLIYFATKEPLYATAAAVYLSLSSLVFAQIELGTLQYEAMKIDEIVRLNLFILGHIVFVLITASVFFEKEKSIRLFKKMAQYDFLTGLPNRYLLEEKLAATLYLSRTQRKNIPIGYVDVDGFKAVNDRCGHHIGDLLLKEIVEKMRRHIDTQEDLIRMGGDEFLILFNRIRSKEALERRLRALMREVRDIRRIEDCDIDVSLSIGIACTLDDGDTIDALIQAADAAMYTAKRKGKNRYVYARNSGRTPVRHTKGVA